MAHIVENDFPPPRSIRADIPTGRWSSILVRGTAPVANLRTVIVFFPSLQEPRDGAVKIDDAQITRLP